MVLSSLQEGFRQTRPRWISRLVLLLEKAPAIRGLLSREDHILDHTNMEIQVKKFPRPKPIRMLNTMRFLFFLVLFLTMKRLTWRRSGGEGCCLIDSMIAVIMCWRVCVSSHTSHHHQNKQSLLCARRMTSFSTKVGKNSLKGRLDSLNSRLIELT
jgi:hypothetical protein